MNILRVFNSMYFQHFPMKNMCASTLPAVFSELRPCVKDMQSVRSIDTVFMSVCLEI